MFGLSPIEMLVIAGVLALGFVVLVTGGVLIKHKRWGVLLAGVASLGVSALLVAFTGAIAYRGMAAEQRVMDRYEAERAAQIAYQQAMRDQTLTRFSTGTRPLQLASTSTGSPTTEELEAVAAAAPEIELDEEFGELAPADNADRKSQLPEWVTAKPAANERVFTSGPFTTPDSCQPDADAQILDWAWELARSRRPDFGASVPEPWRNHTSKVLGRFKTKVHVEPRETSVGEVYVQHTLASISSESKAELLATIDGWYAEQRRERGVRGVAIAGGGVLSLVAVAHLMLRGGAAKPKV